MNTTINNKTIEFGNLTLEGRSGIPTLEIKCGDRSFYLTPFRGYRFQVSGSIDGDGDYGSSPVIRYKESLGGLHYSITTSIIDSAGRDALSRFCDGRGMMPHINSMTHIWYEFIDESHKWLFGTKSNYVILDDERSIKDNRRDGRTMPPPPFPTATATAIPAPGLSAKELSEMANAVETMLKNLFE